MKTLATFIALGLLATAGWSLDEAKTATKPDLKESAESGTVAVSAARVTVKAKDLDVRRVLSDLFDQAGKSFILQPNIRFSLFLSLTDAEFTKALNVICLNANLEYQVRDGIYYVRMLKPGATDWLPERNAAKKTESPKVEPDMLKKVEPKVEPAEPPVQKGTIPVVSLTRRLTTRMAKANLVTVFEEISKQTRVSIEIDPAVPAYRLDAFLINTSLKYALDEITRAANLSYTFTDRQSIMIRPREESRVTLIRDAGSR